MKIEELENKLTDMRKRQQDNLDAAIHMRQRNAEVREEIKNLQEQLDILSYEQRKIQNDINVSQRDGQFYQREIIDLEKNLGTARLDAKAQEYADTLPDFWASMVKGLKEEQDKLDHLIITPKDPQKVIDEIKEINNPKAFCEIEYILRTAKTDYETALKNYAMNVIKGIQITPSMINQAKRVITNTINNKTVMPYWISNDNSERQRA